MFAFITKEIIAEGTREGTIKADHDLWGDKYSSQKTSVTAKVKTNEMRKIPTGTITAKEYTDESIPILDPTKVVTQRKIVTKKFWYDDMFRTRRNRQTGEYTTERVSRTPLYDEVLNEDWEFI